MNSLKSIYSRITSVSGAIDALDAIGISTKEMSGEMRQVSDILDDLGGKWNTLSAEQQQNLGLQVAGRYQLSRFLIMMNQYEQALDATDTALNSAGSGYRENAEYLKSFEARINKVKNAWTEAIISMQDSGLGDTMIVGLETGLDFLQALTKIIDTLGIFPTTIGGATLAFSLFNDKFRDFNKAFSLGVIESMDKLPGVAGRASAGVTNLNTRMTTLAGSSNVATAAVNGLKATLASFLPAAAFMAVGFAISFIIQKLSEQKQEQEELQKTIEENNKKNISALTTNIDQVDSLIERYKNFNQIAEDGGLNVEQEKEYLSIQQELAELFPALISFIDEKGQAHLKSAEEIEKEKEATRGLIELEKERMILEAKDTYKDKIKEIEEYRDEVDKLQKKIEDAKEPVPYERDEQMQKNVDKAINRMEQELLVAQGKLASVQQGIANDSLSVFGAIVDNMEGKLVPQIQSNAQEIMKAVSFEELDPSRLEQHTHKIADITQEMNKAYEAQNKAKYNELTSELEKYVSSVGVKNDIIKNSILTYNDLTEAIDKYKESQRLASQIEEESAEEQEKLSESYSEAVSNIKALNEILEEVNDGHQISADKIGFLMEKYTHLLPYMNDEIALSKEIQKQIAAEEKIAKQAILNKLSYNEQFYKNTIANNAKYVDSLNKQYGIDLKQFKNLAQAKAEVEGRLLSKLAESWNSYYNSISHTIGGAVSFATADFVRPLVEFNDIFLDSVGSITGNSIAQEGLSSATDKNTSSQKDLAKEYENSTYVSDKFKKALEKINLELEKQQNIQSKFAPHSKQYQDSLKKEIQLLKDKNKLIVDQTKALNKQIKSGNIKQTGIVTTNSLSSGSSYTGKYSSEINKAASKYGVDPNLIAAIIQVESNFNPNASSSAGAQGLMQLMPATARSLGVTNSYNVEQNIMGGTKYIAQQLKAFNNNLELALAAYNAGPGNVQKYNGIPPFKETQNYIQKVLNNYSGQAVKAVANSVSDYYLKNFKITSNFGDTSGRAVPHKGIDFANGKQGDPVKALRGGKVITATYSKSAGNWVVIQQDDGTVAKYMHMQNGLNVKAGQTVKAGQQLGKVGNTGQSTGAHVHIQIEQNGKAIDPLSYMNKLTSSDSKEYAQQQQAIDDAKSTVIQLEQDSLAIQQQLQQLYMDLVDSQLAAIDRIKNSYEDDLSKIDLIQKRENETSKEWIKQQGQKEKILAKQVAQEKEAIKFIKQQIKSNKDLNKAQKSLLEDQLVDRYNDLYSLEGRLLDERISMAEKVIDAYKQSLEAQKDASIKAIDDLISEINKEVDEADYKKRLGKAQSERQDILDEIAKLSIDDSFAAQKRIAELTEKLQEQNEAIQDMQDDKLKEDRIENLNQQKETIEDEYENLINDERKFAKMRSDIINGNSKEIQKDLDKFYTNIKSNTKILGKALSNNLIDLINQANRYLNGKEYKPIKVAQARDGGILPSWGNSGRLMYVHEEEMISNKQDTKVLLKALNMADTFMNNLKVPKLNLPSLSTQMDGGTTINYDINLRVDNLNGKKSDAETLLNEIVKGVELKGGKI